MKMFFAVLIFAMATCPAHAAWKKTVTKGGKTTVTGDPETMAQVEKENQAKAAYQKDIAAAPRRAPTDPIRVTLLNPIWEGKERNENLERANKMLADELKADPLLQVTLADIPRKKGDRSDTDILIAEAANKRKAGDVYIHTALGTEAALGRKADGKLAVGNAIAYKADVRSAYEPGVKDAKELGNILQTTQMVKALGKKLGDIIKNDIGPRLPSAKAVDEITKKHARSAFMQETGIEAGDDTKTMLKKMFKPRNQVN